MSDVHELSLCGSIYRIVERAAEGRPVSVIHLQVGKLRQVVPETLQYCWGLVSDETQLSGSELMVESIPVRISCGTCAGQTTVAEQLMLLCEHCGGGDITVISGEEFLLTSLDLAEA